MTQRPTLTNAVNSVFDSYNPIVHGNDREILSQIRDVYTRQGEFASYISWERKIKKIGELGNKLTSPEAKQAEADFMHAALNYIERPGSSREIKNKSKVVSNLRYGFDLERITQEYDRTNGVQSSTTVPSDEPLYPSQVLGERPNRGIFRRVGAAIAAGILAYLMPNLPANDYTIKTPKATASTLNAKVQYVKAQQSPSGKDKIIYARPEEQKTLSIYQKDDKIFVTVIGANDALVDVQMGDKWYLGLNQGAIDIKGKVEQVMGVKKTSEGKKILASFVYKPKAETAAPLPSRESPAAPQPGMRTSLPAPQYVPPQATAAPTPYTPPTLQPSVAPAAPVTPSAAATTAPSQPASPSTATAQVVPIEPAPKTATPTIEKRKAIDIRGMSLESRVDGVGNLEKSVRFADAIFTYYKGDMEIADEQYKELGKKDVLPSEHEEQLFSHMNTRDTAKSLGVTVRNAGALNKYGEARKFSQEELAQIINNGAKQYQEKEIFIIKDDKGVRYHAISAGSGFEVAFDHALMEKLKKEFLPKGAPMSVGYFNLEEVSAKVSNHHGHSVSVAWNRNTIPGSGDNRVQYEATSLDGKLGSLPLEGGNAPLSGTRIMVVNQQTGIVTEYSANGSTLFEGAKLSKRDTSGFFSRLFGPSEGTVTLPGKTGKQSAEVISK